MVVSFYVSATLVTLSGGGNVALYLYGVTRHVATISTQIHGLYTQALHSLAGLTNKYHCKLSCMCGDE